MRFEFARRVAPLVSPLALSFAVPFALGCAAEPPAPPVVHAVALTEVRLNLVAPSDFSLASLFQLRVAADPGANVDVRWSVSDSVRARILDGEVLRLCGALPTLTVTATSVADSTKRASAQATVTELAVPWAAVTSVLDADTGAPADMRALAGDVLVGVGVDERWLRCRGLSRVELSLLTAGNDVVAIESRAFQPAARSVPAQSFRWHTTGVPNGTYRLQLRIYLEGDVDAAWTTATGEVDVRN